MGKDIQIDNKGSLVFLKLGGSLITDKQSPHTACHDVLNRIAQEIADSLQDNPGLKIVLGHGSGSFGHTSGKKHGTRNGVRTKDEWIGFAEVWHDAASLNHIVLDSLLKACLPAVVFPPSASVSTREREIISWDLAPIRSSLDRGLLPVIYGDVVFDSSLGGTILSTEDLFVYLAIKWGPDRILLAGKDPGVYEDYPENTSILSEINPIGIDSVEERITSSGAPDVTGGMQSKVKQMLELVEILPSLKTMIFSGEEPGSIKSVLSGGSSGTVLQR